VLRPLVLCMDTRDPTSEAFRDLVRAAGETLELMCRMRGIALEDLTDDELGEFFVHALGDDV
jgi:hypothetical protein